jgi:hypothetical protein
MRSYLIWDDENKQVIEVSGVFNRHEGESHKLLENAYCVSPSIVPHYKTGMWLDYLEEFGSCNKWRFIPFMDFPSEFKTHLLLLGISIDDEI